jgi:hypothetical protein
MQYCLRLPDGFGPERVTERVAKRNRLFAGVPGLVTKFYLYNEPERIYAPLYIWENNESLQRFLLSGLFDGVVKDFGRPRVRTWNILEFDYGKATGRPRFVRFCSDRLESREKLQAVVEKESEEHRRLLQLDGLYADLVVLDTDRWELGRFVFWQSQRVAERQDTDCVDDYSLIEICEKAA